MTFDEFRRKISATRNPFIDAAHYYALPRLTLPQLHDVLGEPTAEEVDDIGMAHIAYRVDAGMAVIIARLNPATKVLDQSLVFFKPVESQPRSPN